MSRDAPRCAEMSQPRSGEEATRRHLDVDEEEVLADRRPLSEVDAGARGKLADGGGVHVAGRPEDDEVVPQTHLNQKTAVGAPTEGCAYDEEPHARTIPEGEDEDASRRSTK